MTQVYRAGPRRKIVGTGVDKNAPKGEPRFVLKLSCGHLVRRYLIRVQNQGMAQCVECARSKEQT